MKKLKILTSCVIWLFICLPLMFIGLFVIPILLTTKWSGRTTVWGNDKWGRGTDHFATPTKGFLQEFNWLAIRNSVNNLCFKYLAVKQKPYTVQGNELIGDKIAAGSYWIKMGFAWEYYLIKPYTLFKTKRCLRIRIGWKISRNTNPTAPFSFVISPLKTYRGI